MMVSKPTYTNITISGQIATGTTTLLTNLKERLAPDGWHFYSGGAFVREHSKKHDLRLENADSRGDEFSRKLDEVITRRLKTEEKLVVESWLAGFDAQGIDGVLKVLLICPDESVIVDRVINRDHVTVEEAKEQTKTRTASNIAKWKRLYGDHDFWDEKYYDLVIDTFTKGPKETMDVVLEKLDLTNLNRK